MAERGVVWWWLTACIAVHAGVAALCAWLAYGSSYWPLWGLGVAWGVLGAVGAWRLRGQLGRD